MILVLVGAYFLAFLGLLIGNIRNYVEFKGEVVFTLKFWLLIFLVVFGGPVLYYLTLGYIALHFIQKFW